MPSSLPSAGFRLAGSWHNTKIHQEEALHKNDEDNDDMGFGGVVWLLHKSRAHTATSLFSVFILGGGKRRGEEGLLLLMAMPFPSSQFGAKWAAEMNKNKNECGKVKVIIYIYIYIYIYVLQDCRNWSSSVMAFVAWVN
jgi:hypothetical protein